MGARGPAPTPAKLKVLRGETRPSRVNYDEPEVRGLPELPDDLTPAARETWDETLDALGPTGVLTSADSVVLRLYCEAVARYRKAEAILAEEGPLVERKSGEIRHPLVQVVRDEATLVARLARELGLTPSSRSGLSAAPTKARNPLESIRDEHRARLAAAPSDAG